MNQKLEISDLRLDKSKIISDEWIDNLFKCMGQFYGERWCAGLNERQVTLQKAVWKSGLYGLSYQSIKDALLLCRKNALNAGNKPPLVTEFYRYAKGTDLPNSYRPTDKTYKNQESMVASKAMENMRKILRG